MVAPRQSRASTRRHRRGVALIWATLSMVVLLGIVGLAMDTGYCVLTGTQMQAAADAGALAGARIVPVAPTGARTAAADMAGRNTAAGIAVVVDPNADIVIGTYSTTTRTLTPGGLAPNAVRVTVRR